MAVTLQDVAKHAGVSVGTASQALNRSHKVSEATRLRVEQSAESLGYFMKGRRKSEARARTLSVIGVLSKRDVADVALLNPFYSHIYAGIEEECRRHGIGLMFAHIEVDRQAHPVVWPAMVNSQLVDGLIFVGAQIEHTADAVARRLNVPTVLIDSYVPTVPFDTVLIDNSQGAARAMDHLFERGHERIGLIGAMEHPVPSIAARRDRYIHELQRRGLFRPEYIEYSELHREAGYNGARRLLARCPEITAIFACNDDTALGVLSAARDTGLRVPQDLSVIGFDNITLSAEMSPPLTTVHVYKNWMGIMGVRYLVERAARPEKPTMTTAVSTELVVRASTAAPRIAAQHGVDSLVLRA